MIEKAICNLFSKYPEIIFGFADISYSSYADDYMSALIFAVPYGGQLTLENYTEENFEQGIKNAKEESEKIMEQLEVILNNHDVRYFIPPLAQNNEVELLAPFSFKFAAVNAGLGWIGKNDVVITKRYGPRIRLSAVLIDFKFHYGQTAMKSNCPEQCKKCVDVCPCKALLNKQWDMNAKREEIIDYHRCNQMRSAFIEKLGRKSACGMCIAACPYGT